jgi:hypothetical protein
VCERWWPLLRSRSRRADWPERYRLAREVIGYWDFAIPVGTAEDAQHARLIAQVWDSVADGITDRLSGGPAQQTDEDQDVQPYTG